ncbi:SLBB domain-containing protein [Lusitaniella coriacea]|uniref:SLBB domain-containing protein n=1 Tax=Lusitaniella coriacea TaxID=1983105 RepID=UPI003CF34E91
MKPRSSNRAKKQQMQRATQWCCWILASGFPLLQILPALAVPSNRPGIPTLAPNAAPNAPTTPYTPDAPYTLGAGDRVKVDIFDVPEYSGEYPVLIDGTLNLPILGSVEVADLTLTQATERISRAYAPFIVRPLVTLSLIAPRPVQIAVSGEVNRPGTYTVVLEQGRQFPTVTEAIDLAQGFTRSADLRQVQVRRFYQGQVQIFSVDLRDVLVNGNPSQDLVLRDGDTVLLSSTTDISPAEIRQWGDASFAPDEIKPIQVAIVGEVTRAGSYVLEGTSSSNPPTVTQAIEQAGGIKPLADIRNINVRRPTKTGVPQLIEVDLWALLQAGDLSEDLILQAGDTIEIPRANSLAPAEATALASASFAPDIIKVNVVGEVVQPGSVDLQPNAPLNQALLAAGGFNNRAAQGTVELVRLNPDGTVSKQDIDVDLSKGISAENNPSLRSNDVVIVRRSSITAFSDTLGLILEPITRAFTVLSLPFSFLRIFGVGN